ncbi:Serine/threonine-protein kinase TAO3 [Senna tora]|uniref:Serine/threonine-protein kinase TAO3 n=1 Tax=Senna tora TaxID=362788 RepID=A0A834W4M3_9FABA|nr:Serine/threonine-protein kinase TAO3 [Senna tora]
MGNCQAVDAAALVIQHPCGKIERMYWSVPASEIMKMNPGHYVSLIIPLPLPQDQNHQDHKTVRFTRVKLLRPNETLNLGHAYRLITTQEVVKVLRAKKHAKARKTQAEMAEKSTVQEKQKSSASEEEEGKSDTANTYEEMRAEKQRQRGASVNSASFRSKSWRPSLQSISESTI